MRPKERREGGQTDLFRARLDPIIDLDHPLAKLARTIDWGFWESCFGEVYDDDPGRPPLPTQLMAGLAILKHMHDLSDEVLCERWIENPYDGHTLATIIPDIESTIGAEIGRTVTDAGYRGHNAPKERRFPVYVAGQKRGLTAAIKRAFRRRSAVEPVIGHLKAEHRMGRNYLAGSHGDAANAVLAAAGYNFRLLLRWLALLLRQILIIIAMALGSQQAIVRA